MLRRHGALVLCYGAAVTVREAVLLAVGGSFFGTVLACASGESRPAPATPAPPEKARPAAGSCRAPARPKALIKLTWRFRNLTMKAPVGLVQAPRVGAEVGGRWFLLEQYGRVYSFSEDAKGEAADIRVTDLTDRVYVNPRRLGEVGLLGMALHPRFPNDNRAFVTYVAKEPELALRLASFAVDAGRLDLASERVLLEVPEPYENHNGGHIAFGPDGFLYLSSGDGGSGGDPHGNGQNTETLLGTILRLDVDHKKANFAYGIPPDNPFAGGGGRAEIYAYGLRNPWRFSFDRESGELWSGDVGQEGWEELNRIERGGNYGWNAREGDGCFPPGKTDCDSEGFVDPVYVYAHPRGDPRSVTSGFVYRGARLPALVGRLVFGDYETGSISAVDLSSASGQPTATPLVRSGYQVSAFAEDQAGELYVLDYGGNRVLRLDPAPPGKTLPRLLSETGCVDPQAPEVPVAEAVPYDVAVPFWSDGANKERFVVLPPGQTLSVHPDGDLELPRGGVVMKSFSHAGRRLETRFYVRHADGEYSGYSYAWRADGSDAELVEATRVESMGDFEWTFPGPEACHQCHTAPAGRTLGLELRQLALGEPGGSQLSRLVERGVLAAMPRGVEALSTSRGTSERRARSYLHVNCSSCHRPQGPARGTLDVRFDTPLSGSGLCELSSFSRTPRALVVPGHSSASELWVRLVRRDQGGMPPLASLQVDAVGAALVARWIDGLGNCAHP